MATVLLADGDPAFARSPQILLEDEGGYTVKVATSPGAALAELENSRSFRLVISDV